MLTKFLSDKNTYTVDAFGDNKFKYKVKTVICTVCLSIFDK